MQEGLKLVRAYDRKRRPRTPEEYLEVARKVADKAPDDLKTKIRRQRHGEQSRDSAVGKGEAE